MAERELHRGDRQRDAVRRTDLLDAPDAIEDLGGAGR